MSITLIEGNRAVTMGSSNDLALELAKAQCQAGEGPCLTAARVKRTISSDANVAAQWPAFRDASERLGVTSSLSVPLLLRDDVEGGFNLYRYAPLPVPPEERQMTLAFDSQAAAVVLNARAFWKATELARNLAVALQTRGLIERAKGVLMRTMGLSAEEAFDELRKRSQRTNRKLHTIAAEITAESAAPQE